MRYITFFFIALTILTFMFPISKVKSKTQKTTLVQLIQSGQSLECKSEVNIGKARQELTYYMAQKKMRLDSKFTDPGKSPVVGHSLILGDWSYSWGGGNPPKTGRKMKRSEINKFKKKSGLNNQTKSHDIPPLDHEYSLDCKPWVLNQSFFDLPSDVEFKETRLDSETMKRTFEDSRSQSLQKVCEACARQTDEKRRKNCMTALKCK